MSCPKCNNKVVKKDGFFGCSNFPKCHWSISFNQFKYHTEIVNYLRERSDFETIISHLLPTKVGELE